MRIRKVNNKNTGTTIVSVLLDKSGSMDTIRTSTVDAINEYIGNLKKDDANYKFNLTFFDTELEKPYVDVPIKQVGKLSLDLYRPDGMTALYDAVYQTSRDLEEKHGTEKVLFVIMTDGQENSSHEHDQHQVATLIKRLQGKGWTFVFLGANQDSWATAQGWGLSAMNISNFNASGPGIKSVFRTLSDNTRCFAMNSAVGGINGSSSSFFSERDQDKLQNQR